MKSLTTTKEKEPRLTTLPSIQWEKNLEKEEKGEREEGPRKIARHQFHLTAELYTCNSTSSETIHVSVKLLTIAFVLDIYLSMASIA